MPMLSASVKGSGQDGRVQVEDMNRYIENYTEEIEEIKGNNKLLVEELAKEARDDPSKSRITGSELERLHEEGHKYTRKAEVQRRKNEKVEAAIVQCEMQLAELDANSVGENQMYQCQQSLTGRIRKMETSLDRKMVKLNEKSCQNDKLREQIDHLRLERMTMDAVFTNMESDIYDLKCKSDRMKTAIGRAKSEAEKVRDQIESLTSQANGDKVAFETVLNEEWNSLQEIGNAEAPGSNRISRGVAKDEASPYKNIKNMTEERKLRTKVSQGRWQVFQGRVMSDTVMNKYRKYRDFIEKMHAASGTTSVNELVDVFILQEREHFSRIEYVNQLAHDIETCRTKCSKLREQIARLKVKHDAGEMQKTGRVLELKANVAKSDSQRFQLEKDIDGVNEDLSKIKPLVEGLYERIGCVRYSGQRPEDIRKCIAVIESRVVELLRMYRQSSLQGGAKQQAASTRSDGMLTEPLDVSDIREVAHHTTQPYRYVGIKPPTLGRDEMLRGDTVEEEYPLTYHELKSKVWEHGVPSFGTANGDEKSSRMGQKLPKGWKKLSSMANASAQAIQ